ncbi:MAG TPA: hypothetical protein VKC61_08725, partial [Pyrinomonadaceae bacterium]|nr:hypothetical protein [Pyrinomonadaceae bacterium]
WILIDNFGFGYAKLDAHFPNFVLEGNGVSTESGSDRVSIHATVERRGRNPVATALGTDSTTPHHPSNSRQFAARVR